MTYLLLAASAIILFVLYSAWSVWELETYYYERLNGDFFGPFKEVVNTKQKAYIIRTKGFKEWKWERFKKAIRL